MPPPAEHLAAFQGKLQVDGYKGFSSLARKRGSEIELVLCWAHCRRRFYEFYTATQSRLAADALARIASLYAIEAEIRGHPAEHRRPDRGQSHPRRCRTRRGVAPPPDRRARSEAHSPEPRLGLSG